MGENGEGSSNAAQSAQTEDESQRPGFFGRIIEALSPSDTGEETTEKQQARGDAPRAVPLGMMNLRRMRVLDVAIPKADVVAVSVDTSKDDLVEVFRDSGLTRLPVFRGTLDTPVGLIHLKDFALKYGFNGGGPEYDLEAMLRPLIYAPPSMPIGVLLQKMQSERMHMALVDEYGGVDGLVTLEDLVETVIGEIEDEHDLEEGALWMKEATGSWLVEAKAPLSDFEQASGLKLATEDSEDEEIDTLGGLVFLEAGRVPARGEVIEHPTGTEFEVVDADPRRIKRLRVRLPDAAKRDGDGSNA